MCQFLCPGTLLYAIGVQKAVQVRVLFVCLRFFVAANTPHGGASHKLEFEVCQDYGKKLVDTGLADVTFAVDGQRLTSHRCVLAARSAASAQLGLTSQIKEPG